jgi:FKBP-type peptidyl-prolyl cis-trans isomerase 2
LGWVNRHPLAGHQKIALTIQVVRPRPDSFDDAAKLVAQGQRTRHHSVANAGVFVSMQIAAANAGSGNAQ